MPDFSQPPNFEDTSLHQPAFLDLQQYIQATSHPSTENFQTALHHLEAANHGRFIKLKETAKERSVGSGESDLRRLKRHFGSLKNTFIGYDLRQSFLESLEEGRPDGTEEQQLPELERLIEQESAKAKHEKGRNGQLQTETLGIIEDIVATYNSFYAKKAEITSHLECLIADRAQQNRTPKEALPELDDGLDEETCKALLALEVTKRRNLENALAADEAEANELEMAIHSEEEQLRALRSKIDEMEAENQEERTQELTIRLSESAKWMDSIVELQSSMSGIRILEPPTDELHLRLTTRVPGPKGADNVLTTTHELKLGLNIETCRVQSADLQPPDVSVTDIVNKVPPGSFGICSVVSGIQARLEGHLLGLQGVKDARPTSIKEAEAKYSLADAGPGLFSAALAAGVTAVVSVPESWPEGRQGLALVSLAAASGVPMSASVVQSAQPAGGSRSLLELLNHVSQQVAGSFSN